MNFDALVKSVLAAGQIFGPIFIHSPRGVAILNASEETAAAVMAQHAEAHRANKATSTLSKVVKK